MSLVLKDVTASVGDHVLLDRVSTQFRSGEVTAILGPNGAGKTSLLRAASGELTVSAGEVLLDSRHIRSIALEDRAKKLAMLTQQSALDFPFKGEEVIAMGRIPHLTGRRHDREVLDEVMDVCRLRSLAPRVYTTLSGGEKQRVQIARVLAQVWDQLNEAVLIFDEPTSALDLSHQLEFFDILQKVKQGGAAVALVVHDINLAARHADCLCLLSDGSVHASGLPGDVLTRENLRAVFSVEVSVIESAGGHPLLMVEKAV